MKSQSIKIKLSYVSGLKPVVLQELRKRSAFHVVADGDDSVFIKFSEQVFEEIKHLRSVARAYAVVSDDRYDPAYISDHKSLLRDLIDLVVERDSKNFGSFKITCAGSNSPEVRSIARYVQETYQIAEAEEADLKIHIIKLDDIWEVGIQITPRPLSVRDYRVANMSGAMDPTIAFAVNSSCHLEQANSYLNVFSGSGTLLIEAAQCYPNLGRVIGFDHDKRRLSMSVQNIKKAGLIQKVEVREGDIFDSPDFGMFDAISSDLPFGMAVEKGKDLNELYAAFVAYCERTLNPGGRLVAYTSEFEILKPIIKRSKLKVVDTLDLKFMTSVNAYLKPKILVCEL